MNKIVRDHYPVDKLPEDLRGTFSPATRVRVVIEEEPEFDWPGFPEARTSGVAAMSIEEFLEAARLYRERHPDNGTAADAVARIRELRDEWEDE